ncbi:MAG: hypothetical protein R2705_22040 [Ilumatobacteraceae bacterium]
MLKGVLNFVGFAVAAVALFVGVRYVAWPMWVERTTDPVVAVDPAKLASLPELDPARQAIVVSRDDKKRYVLSGYSRNADGAWELAKGPWQVAIGARGFAEPEGRKEGDDTTPIGVYALTGAFGTADPPATAFPYQLVTSTSNDCWISDVDDPAYNTWVVRAGCDKPNMPLGTRTDGRFRLAIIFDFNTNSNLSGPMFLGRGSALFVHTFDQGDSLPRNDAGDVTGTYGGVATSARHVRDLIAWLDPAANPRIVLGRVD